MTVGPLALWLLYWASLLGMEYAYRELGCISV